MKNFMHSNFVEILNFMRDAAIMARRWTVRECYETLHLIIIIMWCRCHEYFSHSFKPGENRCRRIEIKFSRDFWHLNEKNFLSLTMTAGWILMMIPWISHRLSNTYGDSFPFTLWPFMLFNLRFFTPIKFPQSDERKHLNWKENRQVPSTDSNECRGWKIIIGEDEFINSLGWWWRWASWLLLAIQKTSKRCEKLCKFVFYVWADESRLRSNASLMLKNFQVSSRAIVARLSCELLRSCVNKICISEKCFNENEMSKVFNRNLHA